jgi:hypothetical protein
LPLNPYLLSLPNFLPGISIPNGDANYTSQRTILKLLKNKLFRYVTLLSLWQKSISCLISELLDNRPSSLPLSHPPADDWLNRLWWGDDGGKKVRPEMISATLAELEICFGGIKKYFLLFSNNVLAAAARKQYQSI